MSSEVSRMEELDFGLAVEAVRRRVELSQQAGVTDGLRLQLATELSEAKQLAQVCPHCRDLRRELDLLKVVASQVMEQKQKVTA
jgi:hypothetical protein